MIIFYYTLDQAQFFNVIYLSKLDEIDMLLINNILMNIYRLTGKHLLIELL